MKKYRHLIILICHFLKLIHFIFAVKNKQFVQDES